MRCCTSVNAQYATLRYAVGTMRIFIRIWICILHVVQSAGPQIHIISVALHIIRPALLKTHSLAAELAATVKIFLCFNLTEAQVSNVYRLTLDLLTQREWMQNAPADAAVKWSIPVAPEIFSFLPRCMKCRRGLAMRILSVRPSVRVSVCLSHACIVTKRKKDLSRFLYHTKEHLA